MAVAAVLLIPWSGTRGQTLKRVAFLGYSNPSTGSRYLDVLRDGLRAAGWIEGQTLVLDVRWPEGTQSRWRQLIQELLALKPDLFVTTIDDQAVLVASASPLTPVVFVYGNGPLETGLVASLARPGGNVTGFNTMEVELTTKQLALLKESVPGLGKVALLFNSTARGQRALQTTQEACRRLGLIPVPVPLNSEDELEAALGIAAKAGAKGAVEAWTGGLLFVSRARLGAAAIKHGIAMHAPIALADTGVLLSYGANPLDLFRRAAQVVDRILRGAKPAEIPVEQPVVYDLVVNLRTARALGIELPASILLQATRVIR
jgi:putative ABC transport system substrate-binding protein